MTKKFFDILPPRSEEKIKGEKTTLIYPVRSGVCGGGDYQEKNSKAPSFKFWLILIVLISLGTFSYFHLSKAKVEIWPQVENINFKTEIKIDKTAKGIIQKTLPGEFIEEEKESSMEFPSSGVVEKKDFARGKIRVHNETKKPVALIKNTRFLSDEGKQFHCLKEITIPAKGYIDGVDVEADGAGEEYNIGPSKFSVPNLRKYSSDLFYNIWAESLEAMEGGFVGQSAKVTEDDLKNAETVLLEKLLGSGKDSLKASVNGDGILIDDLVGQEVIEKFPLTKADQEIKSFVFKAKIKSTGFVFKKTDLEKFAKDFIYSQTEENKKLVEKSLNLNYSIKEKDLDQGRVVLSLEISAEMFSEPDNQILIEKIKGKSAIEAEYFLEKEQGIFKAEIKLWPFWVKTVPADNRKIELKLEI